MDLIHKDSYVYDDKVVRSYHFDNNDGLLNYDLLIDLLAKSDVNIESIAMAEFGDMYDDKAHFLYPNYETYKKCHAAYEDIPIESIALRGKLKGYDFKCQISPTTNSMSFVCEKSLNDTHRDSYVKYLEGITENVRNNPKR